MAAHEWRQPLGALQFGIGLLRRPNLDPAHTARTLSTLERNARHLIELTHKLESIARVQGDVDNAVVQQVAASTIAHEAGRQLRDMAEMRGVIVEVADDLPTLTVDVGRLELVFVNLLSNAIKYSDASKAERRVEIRGALDDGARCRFEVRDNGVGIPAHALTAIFQRFTRAHTDREELAHVAGVGLGLSIADDCVRTMGGRIEVQSVEGQGSVFIVTLPASPSREP
jgi:signal transduction histidine kinase